MIIHRTSRGHLAACALVVTLALFAGCSSSIRPQDIAGPTASMETQRAGSGELLAPPGPFDHWESPLIRISTDGWKQQQKEGGVSLEPEAIWDLDVPADQAVTFEWSARPRSKASSPPSCETCPKGEITGYRWALDIEDITDETPRTNEDTDLAHWSTWSLATTSATIGPFNAREEHVLSVEARDSKGFVSLVTLRLRFVDEVSVELAQH